MVTSHNIPTQLTYIAKFKLAYLYFNHHIARQIKIIEKQVYKILCLSNLQTILLTYIGKTCPQFCKEVSDIIQ